MKKYILIILVLISFTFSSNSYGEGLKLSGQSYILLDELSGRVLVEKNSNKKLAMASTTKIMTALVALEYGILDDLVEIGEESTNIEGSSLYLKPGEVIPLRDLLYGLMLRSGNDSAIAIANHISGNEEEFVRLMNEKAKSIGAHNTSFGNPHGLPAKNHYSTSYDLAIITKEAFKYAEFGEIVGAKTYNSSRELNNYFVNKNKTLWEYAGGNGVKIGYTMEAGRCLVSSAQRNEMKLIAVCLNSPNWFNDNYKLFDYGFENYKQYVIYDSNQFMVNINVENGKNKILPLVMENELIYPLMEDEKEKLKIVINTDKLVEAPIIKNQVLGKLQVYLDGILIKEENLIARKDILKKTLVYRIMEKLNLNK